MLLKTVSVSSLSNLVKLCNYVVESNSRHGVSYFERYTTTIVLSGMVYSEVLISPGPFQLTG